MISRKDMLLEKARNRNITQDESDELKSILEEEAQKAKSSGDIIGFLIIMGLLVFLAALVAELFKD